MISVCNEVKPLPTWNFHKISPTYLSANLISPLQLPFRDTVPRSNIIAEGTGRRFPRIEWSTFTADYGGIGDLPYLNKRRRRYEELLTPRGHRHFLSSCGKMRHDVVQPSKITTLLKSNLRQNDEFILSPNRITPKEVSIMREENHFIQEPVYSSHASRNEMFPKSRVEYDCPPLPRDFRQKQPLSDTTRQGLAGVANRRYKVTSYTNHYPGFYFNKPEKEDLEVDSKKRNTSAKHEHYVPNKPANNHAVKGLWPCWPTSNNFIVSDVTGQIVEKKDVVSLDDNRDSRMNTTPTQEKMSCEEQQQHTNFKSFSSKDYVPNTTVNIYGCGPGTIGDRNVEREIPIGTENHVEPQIEDLQRIPRRLSVWEPSNHVCRENVAKSPPKSHHSSPNPQAYEYSHQKYYRKLESLNKSEMGQDMDYSMQQRWALDKKMDRLAERIGCCPTSPQNEMEKSESELELEDIECKEDDMASPDKHVTFTTDPITEEDKQNDVYPISPYFTTRNNYGWEKPIEQPQPKDNSLVSLELAKNTRRFSDLLESVTACDKEREIKEQRRKAQQLAELEKVNQKINAADNLKRAYNSAHIKLPPHPLWTSLKYDGDRVPDRLGVRFKTVASKRYHAVHPEPIPDLRELRPTLRKSRILGYHTSTFR